MAQRFYNDPANFGIGYPVIGVNSGAFAAADAVYIDSSGFLASATTSSKVLGFSAETITTLESDNQTVDQVKPKYYYAEGVLVVFPADQAATQTDIGAYADLGTATSGSQTLNLAAGATGQFFVVGFDPENDGTTTDVVVKVAEPQHLAFAQS